MLPSKFAYPFDPSGESPENRVPTEQHTIAPPGSVDFRFIVPRAGPYFLDSIELYHVATGKKLELGLDWVPGHVLEGAKLAPPYADVYGSCLILNNNLSGTIRTSDYQTIGGNYTIDENALLEMLANTQIDPRITTWESVIGAPSVMDPLSHLHHMSETAGYDDMVAEFKKLVEQFTLENSKLALAILQHTEDTSNPHLVNLTKLGIERFKDCYRAELSEILAGEENLNYITPDNFRRALDIAMAALNLTGDEGDLPFMTGTGKVNDTLAGPIQENVSIVENAEELTAQLGTREDFGEVFSTWRRIAMGANNPEHSVSELQGWSYNPATNQINSTINSGSLIGLLSPDKIEGDYVFEVEVSSTSVDDDYIGILLGLESYNGKMRALTLMRDCQGRSTGPDAKPYFRLWYDYNGANATQLITVGPFAERPNGWSDVPAIKIRARRIGSVLYVATSEPGGALLSEHSYDLNSRAETRVFAGAVSLGYCSHSQQFATWKTIRRTGANPIVAALHTGDVYEWTGAAYTKSATKKIADVVKRGRYYWNKFLKRMYYSPGKGVATAVSRESAIKEVTNAKSTRNRTVLVDLDDVAYVGKRIVFTSTAANGVTTPKGGIEIGTNGNLSFLKPNGDTAAYFDDAGILQHWGMDHKSDARLKHGITVLFKRHGVEYCKWVWAEHHLVPSSLWGREGYGVIAQQVMKLYPQFVHLGDDGFYSVAEDKLALFLALKPRNTLLTKIQNWFVRYL